MLPSWDQAFNVEDAAARRGNVPPVTVSPFRVRFPGRETQLGAGLGWGGEPIRSGLCPEGGGKWATSSEAIAGG